jgi:putative DNA modification/repair radical SAM protein
MNLLDKVRILGAAGKWDVCASSSSSRKTSTMDRVGNAAAGGICHSFTEGGRCISLFKTLLTNSCGYDCKYCQNSAHCKKTHAEYEPHELAKVFMSLYLGNYVEGLFLSSGIAKDPDATTQKMLDTVMILRNEHKFQGYIHFKVLPGADLDLIRQAAEHSDRLSINIEAPNRGRLDEISGMKDFDQDIVRRQQWIRESSPPAGQTTQVVVGAGDETDEEVLDAASWEYDDMGLRRVYYSAFMPLDRTPLSERHGTSLEREHRLYCVDFMMRKYRIPLSDFECVFEGGNLPPGDPKVHLARLTLDGPVDVNTAALDELLRVPGIGPQSAQRIIAIRRGREKVETRSQLHNIGVVLKRADPFIKIQGRVQRTIVEYGG